MSTPRERALARIKTLAAAGLVAGCGAGTAAGPGATGPGYGVVDPLPPPTCFESPKPNVTAKYVGAAAENGSRLVEVTVSFSQPDTKVGEQINATALGNALEVTEKTINAKDFRFVFRAPKDTAFVELWADVTCPQGSGFQASLSLDAKGVTVTNVR